MTSRAMRSGGALPRDLRHGAAAKLIERHAAARDPLVAVLRGRVAVRPAAGVDGDGACVLAEVTRPVRRGDTDELDERTSHRAPPLVATLPRYRVRSTGAMTSGQR